MKPKNKNIYGTPEYLDMLQFEYKHYCGVDTLRKGNRLVVLAVRQNKEKTENQLRKERGLRALDL